MSDWALTREDPDGLRFWGYGNPGKWVNDVKDARLYAKRQSANNAKVLLLKRRKDVQPDTLTVMELK